MHSLIARHPSHFPHFGHFPFEFVLVLVLVLVPVFVLVLVLLLVLVLPLAFLTGTDRATAFLLAVFFSEQPFCPAFCA